MAEIIDFKKLYDNCFQSIYLCIKSKCKNKSDAEDLTAEAFALAFKNRRVFKSEEHAKRWLYIVAQNLFFNFCKKKRIENRTFNETETCASDDYAIEKGIYDIDELSDIDKQIIFYKFYQKFTNYEIAQMLGIKSNTIKSRIRRALKKLKNHYEDHHED